MKQPQLATEFSIRYEKLSKKQKYILDEIGKLKLKQRDAENRKKRIANLVKTIWLT